jgi:hypothetical protein
MHRPLVISLAVVAFALPPQFCVAQESAAAACASLSEPSYDQKVVQKDGKPRFQITNRSVSPIIAFVMEQFASPPPAVGGALPAGGRFYYDLCFDPREYKPIAQGESITHPLGYFEGADVSKVRAEVRAVILEDGSTSGGARWINATTACAVYTTFSRNRCMRGSHGKKFWKTFEPPMRMSIKSGRIMSNSASSMIWFCILQFIL